MDSKQERWSPQLDGLRAVAVNLVFFHHWVSNKRNLGIVGVQLFFVLSGFLITRILLRQRSEVDYGAQSVWFSASHFYARRFLRIFPLYYFCLGICLFLGRFEMSRQFWWHFFYLSNIFFFLHDNFYVPFAHFWSLSVEEQFYLLWPWVVFLAPHRVLKPVIVSLIVLAPLTRWFIFASGRTDFVQTSTLLLANLDTLGLGALLACLVRENSNNFAGERYLGWAALAGLTELVVSRVTFPGMAPWWVDPIAVAVMAVWLVRKGAIGFGGFAGSLLSHPVLVYLGRISYGLYIWHMFAPPVLRNLLRVLHLPAEWNNGVIGYSLLYAWTVAAASFTWVLFERPINRLKRYFQYRKTAPLFNSPLVEIPSS